MQGAISKVDIAKKHLLPQPFDIARIFANQQRR